MVSFFYIINYTVLKAQKQVVLTISQVPEYTPTSDTLFLCSSLNNWELSDSKYKFKKLKDNTYQLLISLPDNPNFEFKINRGNWDKVEGNIIGDFMTDRKFIYSDSIIEYNIQVESWQDLFYTYYPPIEIRVVSYPANTPHDAKLYITGDFNNWSFYDPEYELTKLPNGTYYGKINAGYENFEYKFSRGSWTSVEGRWDGGILSNRKFISKGPFERNIISARISSWEDISQGHVWNKLLFLILIALAVKIIILTLYFSRSAFLIILTSITAISFFLLYVYNGAYFFNIYPKGHLVSIVLYAFLGPWLYLWLHFSNPYEFNVSKFNKNLAYILPLISFLILFPYINKPTVKFLEISLTPVSSYYSIVLYIYALILNLYFGKQTLKLIKTKNTENSTNLLIVFNAFMKNWYFNIFLGVIAIFAFWYKIDLKLITGWMENLVWVGVGVTILYIEWVIVLKAYSYVLNGSVSDLNDKTESENWNDLKNKLTLLMDNKSLYTNPKLTLSDLSKHLGTNTHYMSKVINEGFEKNFSDYINSYRIDAFIKALKNDPESSNTYLSLAYKVGFNSKSVFNRAFKKHKNCTPREYFSQID